MMHSACSRGLFTLVAALGLVGCSSPASRGVASLGNTPAMVQRTMGQPDEKRDAPNAAGGQAAWIYKNYFPQTAPREKTGWTEVLSPGVQDQRGKVVQQPVTRDVYRTPAAEDIQVTFTDGVVSSVEHLRR